MLHESWASSAAVSRVMRANRGRDTAPEMALRRLLHAKGLRYRVGASPLAGSRRTVDLVFGPSKVAVEVKGCFWHACPEHYRPSRLNADFWASKIARNVERDREKEEALTRAGWLVIIVWEHESSAAAADRVESAVWARRRPRSST